jgi:methylmalonyl-CoA mutase, C-terminal domain
VRILLSKLGLDGHDRGLRVLARALRERGHEVIILGIGATPRMIATSAVQDDVRVVGISILSGAHMMLVPKILEELQGLEATDIPVVVGGLIAPDDARELRGLGVAAVVPTGTELEAAVEALIGSALEMN